MSAEADIDQPISLADALGRGVDASKKKMEESEEELANPMSIADALKEGVRSAGSGVATSIDQLDGASKCAVLLLAVGAEAAADVLRLLTPVEVQQISSRMATVRALSRELVTVVLREFRDSTANNAQVTFDTDSFMQNMLSKALGNEGASDLLGKLESAIDMSGVKALKRMEPDVLYEMIKNEHPQVIATVMVFLEPGHAAATARLFPDAIRDELMLRVALLQKVQPAALKELNEVMSRAMEGSSDTRRNTVGGIVPTAEILNFLSGGMDKQALSKIREHDPELAQQIVEQMFTFEDLIDIDDRSLQTLLLEVSPDTLVVALKAASPDLKEKFFKNMARRAAEAAKEDLETRGPMRIQDVEEQQKAVLVVARGLADDGRINLQRGKQADQFV